MSSAALQLDYILKTLPAARAAELEILVLTTIEQFRHAAEIPNRTPEERHASFLAAAGTLPDFPADYEESPRETDRDPLP